MFRQCSASDVEPFSGQKEGFPAKKGNLGGPGGQKREFGGPGGLQAADCSRKSLTVVQVLFRVATVVLLLLFELRTVLLLYSIVYDAMLLLIHPTVTL